MPLPTKARIQTSITLELLVDVECEICPAEPDVGISAPYCEDLTILAIGTEKNEPPGIPDWMPSANPQGGYSTDLLYWLHGCIIEQCGDRLEEQLMDSE